MAGTLDDTYVAALQHELVSVPEKALKLGVVRRPTPWFYAEIDDNRPELGPPEELLEAFKNRYETLQDQGLAEARAHNTALADINYDERYLTYLDQSAQAQQAIETIRERLNNGEDVVLVCYENTEKKRCHRTLLLERIRGHSGP